MSRAVRIPVKSEDSMLVYRYPLPYHNEYRGVVKLYNNVPMLDPAGGVLCYKGLVMFLDEVQGQEEAPKHAIRYIACGVQDCMGQWNMTMERRDLIRVLKAKAYSVSLPQSDPRWSGLCERKLDELLAAEEEHMFLSHMARRIQRAWFVAQGNPYTVVGRNRLMREASEMSAEFA